MRKWFGISILIALILIGVFFFARVFITDRFIVRGSSMEPTLHTGTRIYVNKLILGARIYKDFDFSKPAMSCFRMPGLRSLKTGDIAVFNYPEGWEEGKIGFKINYVYAKRCIGVGGDTVRIENGYYRNSSYPGAIIGYKPSQDFLSETPDSLLKGVTIDAMEHKLTGWTIRDLGPFYIPHKGDVIALDSLNIVLYRNVIVFETGREPLCGAEYHFRENYCFFGGDNVLNSRDSRYIGLVPESYVIGVTVKRCY